MKRVKLDLHVGSHLKHATALTMKIAAQDPAIHLITVLYRSEVGLSTFLDCLQAQNMPNWRLYVIDNASPDVSRHITAAREDPRIILHHNRVNLGFAAAVNQGLRAAAAAGAEFFLIINNDTSFEPDFLRNLLTVREQVGAHVIAPRIMRLNNPDICWYAGGGFYDGSIFTNVHHQEYQPTDDFTAVRVDFAPGCCLGINRTVLERAGLFDESFFVYWEDTDFCMRLKTLNIPVLYVSEPSLLHAGAASSGGESSFTFIRLYYRSYIQLLRKHFGWRRAVGTTVRLLKREMTRPIPERRLRSLAIALALGLGARLAPSHPPLDLQPRGASINT